MPVTLFATEDQQRVITCPARYIGLFAGRRWGKTLGVIMNRIIHEALTHPRRLVAYIAPSHKLSKFLFRAILEALSEIIKRSDAQFPFVLEFENGSRVEFYSWARPYAIRGSGYDLVIFDEIQECRDKETFWAVVRPLISDRQGTLLVAGQFRGKNWFYNEFCSMAGREWNGSAWQDSERKGERAAFIFPASTGYVYQTDKGKADLRDAKASIPRVIFDQEYECIPTANQAAVFHMEDLGACTRGQTRGAPEPGKRYAAGLDLGAHRDQGALVILELPGAVVVHAEGLPLGLRHEELAMRVGPTVRRFGALPVVDVTGGATGGHAPQDAYVKFYRQQFPNMRAFTWTRENKQRAIRILSAVIEQRKVSIPAACTQLLDELALYEFTYRAWGYEYHGPQGARDNLVAAFALAVVAWDGGWIGTGQGFDLGRLVF